jgi:hypothetical protein
LLEEGEVAVGLGGDSGGEGAGEGVVQTTGIEFRLRLEMVIVNCVRDMLEPNADGVLFQLL